jgi:hypothetical protein
MTLSAGNTNITLSLPPGATNHGNPRLFCTQPKWYDFVLFFFSNYIAHAASVISPPGQHWFTTLGGALLALLLPISGVSRCLPAILNHAVTEHDPITKAARAGALCMVVRAGWGGHRDPSQDMREWWDAHQHPLANAGGVENNKRWVHGRYKLKRGYCLVIVPPQAAVSAPPTSTDIPCYSLASSCNIPKLMISFIQAIWAAVTLYRSRGDQIEQFGYAAFGLTVTQYAFMSVFNTIGNLLRPEYHSLFMIRTPLMDEAEKGGCYFEGDIKVQIGKGKSPSKIVNEVDQRFLIVLAMGTILGSTVLAVIGGLSGFKQQDSTSVERGFTISWIVVSILFGPWVEYFHFEADTEFGLVGHIYFLVICTFIFGVPAIGGMVVVVRMIHRFGICTVVG